jgi:hypothetical protein
MRNLPEVRIRAEFYAFPRIHYQAVRQFAGIRRSDRNSNGKSVLSLAGSPSYKAHVMRHDPSQYSDLDELSDPVQCFTRQLHCGSTTAFCAMSLI